MYINLNKTPTKFPTNLKSRKKNMSHHLGISLNPCTLALPVSTQLPLARYHLHLLSAIAASSPPHQATSVQPWKGRQLGNDQCDKAPEFYPTYQEVQKFSHVGEKLLFVDGFFCLLWVIKRVYCECVYIYIQYVSKSISSLPRERVSKVTYVYIIIYDVAWCSRLYANSWFTCNHWSTNKFAENSRPLVPQSFLLF